MQKVLIEAGWMDWDKYLPMLQPQFQAQQAMAQQQQAQQAQMLQEQQMMMAQEQHQADLATKQAGALKQTADAASTAAPMIQQLMGGGNVPTE